MSPESVSASVKGPSVDAYGGPAGNRMRPAVNIIQGIRNACGKDFLIGYRLGTNAPSLMTELK